jgi:hypothetical protein
MGLVGISPTSRKPAVSGGLAKFVGGGLDAASVLLAATLD